MAATLRPALNEILAARVDGALETPAAKADWRHGLPQLSTAGATLRELRLSDAPSLAAALATEQVARFISPPPTTAQGFERFIAWTGHEQAAGRYVCFGIVPTGMDH